MQILQIILKRYGVYVLSFLKEWFTQSLKSAHKNAAEKSGEIKKAADGHLFLVRADMDENLSDAVNKLINYFKEHRKEKKIFITSDLILINNFYKFKVYGVDKFSANDDVVSPIDSFFESYRGKVDEYIIYRGSV